MRLLLPAFAALILLLAGCSSSPPQEVEQPSRSATATSTAPTVPEVPPLPAPQTEICDVVRTNAGTSAGLGVYADRALADTGCFFGELFGDLSWAGSALVEIEWTPQASMTAADAWFESDNCVASPTAPCDLPHVSGATPPLAMEIAGDDFLENVQANLEVQVAAQGAVAQQAFKMHITIFANSTVDAGFSALA